MSAGDRGTKIISDSVLYTCMKELRRGNSNSENYQKMRIACLRQYRRRIELMLYRLKLVDLQYR